MSAKKSSKSSSNSSISSSYEEVTNEQFNWKDEETNKEYINFPLKKWHFIVYQYINISNNYVINDGNIYQNTVNKILKEDVFKGEDFYEENLNYLILSEDNEIRRYVDNDFSKILGQKLENNKNKWINPDFIVLNINKTKLFEIINKRQYMMFFNQFNIPDKIDTINIIGEIKQKPSEKSKGQQSKYALFLKNYKKKYFILMNVYDVSYTEFLNKKKNNSNDDIPQIICYIPRTYLNDCYKKYNDILTMKNSQPIEWETPEEYIKKNIEILNQTLNEKKKNLSKKEKDLNEKKQNLSKKEKDLNEKKQYLNENIAFLNKYKTLFIMEKKNLLEAQEELKNKKKIFEKDNTKKLDKKEEDLKKEKEDLKKEEEDLKKEKEDLKKEKEKLDQKEEKLDKKEEKLDKKEEDLKKEEEDLKKEKEDLKKEEEDLKKEKEDLKKEEEILEKKEEEITSLEKELNEFYQQLEKINKEKKK